MLTRPSSLAIAFLVSAVLFCPHGRAAEEVPTRVDVFTAQQEGYETYRIPGLVVTSRGTLLAYCEARKNAKTDWGETDVLMRRSADGGRTWDEPRKVASALADAKPNPVRLPPEGSEPGATLNNPVAIADPTGQVYLVYCVNYARCFCQRSDDDGLTFAPAVEITSAFEPFRKSYDWKVIATGPGHGIRLQNGRLLVPVWLSPGTGRGGHHPSCVATIYSDDGAKTWHAGEIACGDTPETPDPNETAAVELRGGRVMLNMRNESPRHRRLVTVSPDGATVWSKPAFDDALLEPICFGSLARLTVDGEPVILWSNPANDSVGGKLSKQRINLTVRASFDDGKTWPASRLLQDGVAGYSDLATGPDGAIYCFYERGAVSGKQTFTQSLTLARFTLGWVEGKP